MMILLRAATIKGGIGPTSFLESLLARWSTNVVDSKAYSTSIGMEIETSIVCVAPLTTKTEYVVVYDSAKETLWHARLHVSASESEFGPNCLQRQLRGCRIVEESSTP